MSSNLLLLRTGRQRRAGASVILAHRRTTRWASVSYFFINRWGETVNLKVTTIAVLALLVSACSTYTTPRYAIDADTNVALKGLNTSGLSVGAFTGPTSFDNSCRAAGPLAAPDGMSYSEYIRKALEDELKVAGVYVEANPRITLSGVVNKLEFSSSRGLTGGSWDIQVSLNSSNGKTLLVAEHYEFESEIGRAHV